MAAFFDKILYGLQVLWGVITGFTLSDALDILIVAYLIYKIIQLVRGTKAATFIKGVIIVVVLRVVASVLNLDAINWVMEEIVFQYGIIALLIVFQPELRKILERIGRSSIAKFGRNLASPETAEEMMDSIEAVCTACKSMSDSKTGALIVFEREVMLNDIIDSGTTIDALASTEQICNIFFPKAPLHDGAVVMRYGRVIAAGCILPLTNKEEISRELGTRHRAAIGMSETSDAVVIVVSEETGAISVAKNGILRRHYSPEQLRTELEKSLLTMQDEDQTKKKNIFSFMKGWKKNG